MKNLLRGNSSGKVLCLRSLKRTESKVICLLISYVISLCKR